jgi:3-isopropylmalate dehydrogenase
VGKRTRPPAALPRFARPAITAPASEHAKGSEHAMASKTVLILPGDGIGPEVMAEVRRIADWLNQHRHLDVAFDEAKVGGAAIDDEGAPITDATMKKAQDADAVLLGAVGGPKWDGLPFDRKPERGLLRLRKEMALFANLRPAMVFDQLVEASSLKPELVRGLDIMIVRELTGGVYFGEPRGIEDLGNGERRGVNTQVYTTSEIRRVAAVAFELARKRANKVVSTEKANVMESGVLWREEVERLHQEQFGDVHLTHMYADNCAMQLVRQPKQFDVIVTDNLFGDMLSDEAAMLTGSLGMLPSASLGAVDAEGRRKALYEPVHGSAPDIVGKDMANPIATLLSFAMLLRYSLDRDADAALIETAVQNVLAGGIRTADIMTTGMARVSTGVMGDSIMRALSKLVS